MINLKQNLKNEESTSSKKSDFSFEEGVAKIYTDPKCLKRANKCFFINYLRQLPVSIISIVCMHQSLFF
jgi:hypothetical protein